MHESFRARFACKSFRHAPEGCGNCQDSLRFGFRKLRTPQPLHAIARSHRPRQGHRTDRRQNGSHQPPSERRTNQRQRDRADQRQQDRTDCFACSHRPSSAGRTDQCCLFALTSVRTLAPTGASKIAPTALPARTDRRQRVAPTSVACSHQPASERSHRPARARSHRLPCLLPPTVVSALGRDWCAWCSRIAGAQFLPPPALSNSAESETAPTHAWRVAPKTRRNTGGIGRA